MIYSFTYQWRKNLSKNSYYGCSTYRSRIILKFDKIDLYEIIMTEDRIAKHDLTEKIAEFWKSWMTYTPCVCVWVYIYRERYVRQANFGRKARKENLTINSSNQVLDIVGYHDLLCKHRMQKKQRDRICFNSLFLWVKWF